jgi:hypothetical protein
MRSSRADSHRRKGVGIDRHAGVQRPWATGAPVVGRKAHGGIARGDENIPVEILRLLSDWLATLEERMTVPGTSLGAMIEYVSALEESLSGVSARTFTSPQHGS